MNYGIPYKGSKNKLAERIVHLLPKRTHLIDLFCGGCAVSHAALLMGKYEHIHINDINELPPRLFLNALNGEYENEDRWISREDFHRLKDTDPYVAVVWSFGNNLRDYLYSREIEPLKKAIHFAVHFADSTLAQELGYDLSFVADIPDKRERYRAIKQYFRNPNSEKPKGGGIKGLHSELRRPAALGETPSKPPQNRNFRLQSLEETCRLRDFKKKTMGRSTQHRTERAYSVAWNIGKDAPACPSEWHGGGNPCTLTHSALDYAAVPIPEDSVIYCDIPYIGTNTYNPSESFDHERFYHWAERQTQPVFISSYDMPSDRFKCIEEYSHRFIISATANNPVTERIYIPRNQTIRGNTAHQLKLF